MDQEPTAKVKHPISTIFLTEELLGQWIPLGKPLLRKDGLLCIGTENSQTTEQYLILCHCHLKSGIYASRLFQVDQQIRDLQWLTPSSAVMALGNGLRMLEFPDVQPQLELELCKFNRTGPDPHQDVIREVATCLDLHLHIASGGFDKSIVLTSATPDGAFLTQDSNFSLATMEAVSSIRWHRHAPNQFTWAEDGCSLALYDIRSNRIGFRSNLSTILPQHLTGGLFTHDTLGDGRSIVLGFEKGQIATLDMRRPNELISTFITDSNVSSIGDIRQLDGLVAIFGQGGFCLWKLHQSDHSVEQTVVGIRPSNLKTNGDTVLLQDKILGISTSHGDIEFYHLTE